MELMLSQEDVAALRSDTKGCEELIHFDNAGSSLPPDVVVDTVLNYQREEALSSCRDLA